MLFLVMSAGSAMHMHQQMGVKQCCTPLHLYSMGMLPLWLCSRCERASIDELNASTCEYRGMPILYCQGCASTYADTLQDEDVLAAFLRQKSSPGPR